MHCKACNILLLYIPDPLDKCADNLCGHCRYLSKDWIPIKEYFHEGITGNLFDEFTESYDFED